MTDLANVSMDLFQLGGDPAEIRSSARRWQAFSTAARTAADKLDSVDASDFVGTEGDMYRHHIKSDMAPHLHTTADAWNIVYTALNTYANTLEGLQSRMATLRARAGSQRSTLSGAQSALSTAQSNDQKHTLTLLEDPSAATKPGAKPYVSQTANRQSTVNSASAAFQSTVNAANGIHHEHDQALDTVCSRIHHAKEMRLVHPPGLFSRLCSSFKSFVVKHLKVLSAISGVLKIISSVASLLACIPVLAPIMEPIAFVTGAAAFAIDLTTMWATGKWNAEELIMDGVGLIPGARSMMELRVVGRLGAVGRGLGRVAEMDKLWKGVDIGVDLAGKADTAYDIATGQDKLTDWTTYLAIAGSMGSPVGGSHNAIARWNAATAVAGSIPGDVTLINNIRSGKWSIDDLADDAEALAQNGEAAKSVVGVTKYRNANEGTGYTAGHQHSHEANTPPEYKASESKQAMRRMKRVVKTKIRDYRQSMSYQPRHAAGHSSASAAPRHRATAAA